MNCLFVLFYFILLFITPALARPWRLAGAHMAELLGWRGRWVVAVLALCSPLRAFALFLSGLLWSARGLSVLVFCSVGWVVGAARAGCVRSCPSV